jgi:hypothetical protein
VIALDDGDRAAGPEQPAKDRQRLDRSREVLQDETDEDVVEGLGGERECEEIRLLELDIRQPGLFDAAPRLGD